MRDAYGKEVTAGTLAFAALKGAGGAVLAVLALPLSLIALPILFVLDRTLMARRSAEQRPAK